MRPIHWGVIWFFIGMVGWVFFSVIVGVGTGLAGQKVTEAPPLLLALMYLFGIAFFFSLPVAVIAEIVRWRRNKTRSTASFVPSAGRVGLGGRGLVGSPAFCPKCGTRVDLRMWYCPNCHAQLTIRTPDVSALSKKRHSKVKRIGAGVSVLVILIIVGAAFAPTHPATSATTIPASSPCRIEVTKVVLDQTSVTNGNSYYLLTVDASYSGDGSWNVHPLDFQLVSSSSSVYQPAIALSEKTALSDVTLSNGQHDIGQIAFDLPNGKVPSKLEYLSQLPTIKVETSSIPQVSSWVSTVSFAEVSVRDANGLPVFATGSIQNTGMWYYSGEVVVVKVAVTYAAVSGVNPSSISVTTISDSDGFATSKIEPSLPLTVNGNGQEVDIVVSLVAPPFSYSGNMNLVVAVSS
jgi:hypothetical protein